MNAAERQRARERQRRRRARAHNGEILLRILVDEADLTAKLAALGYLSPMRADDRAEIEAATAALLGALEIP